MVVKAGLKPAYNLLLNRKANYFSLQKAVSYFTRAIIRLAFSVVNMLCSCPTRCFVYPHNIKQTIKSRLSYTSSFCLPFQKGLAVLLFVTLLLVATRTGLEPVLSTVTVSRINQLSQRAINLVLDVGLQPTRHRDHRS